MTTSFRSLQGIDVQRLSLQDVRYGLQVRNPETKQENVTERVTLSPRARRKSLNAMRV